MVRSGKKNASDENVPRKGIDEVATLTMSVNNRQYQKAEREATELKFA
jgi:hypothetical protein